MENFTDICQIAQGGYGVSVYRVVHKLDKCVYAIKKIQITGKVITIFNKL